MCKLCNYYKTNYSNYKYCPECGKYIHNDTPKFFNNNILFNNNFYVEYINKKWTR